MSDEGFIEVDMSGRQPSFRPWCCCGWSGWVTPFPKDAALHFEGHWAHAHSAVSA